MRAHRLATAAKASGLAVASLGLLLAGAAAQVGSEGCRKIEVADDFTQDIIIGIEDIEIHNKSGSVFLSAHDRWALEDAVSAGASELPQGGLYTFALDWGKAPPERLTVEDLSIGFKSESDFRPQGLTLVKHGKGQRLFVINQRYLEDNGSWRHSPTIEVFDRAEGALVHSRTLEHPSICAPNGLAALAPDTLLMTNDHGACDGVAAWIEDLLPLDHSNLVGLTFTEDLEAEPQAGRVVSGFRFANGVAVSRPEGDLVYVADTRRDTISVFPSADLRSGTGGPVTSLALPAGPDNLRWAPDGRLITAVHPSLLTLGLYVKRWFGVAHAPSRVVAVSPDDGSAEILFDDPDGELISAATAAAVHIGWLLIGSAFGPGLVVCRLPEAAPREEAQP